MITTDGFVDLRISHQTHGSANEDSVWPSFTDIMTVVVMIFLMALVIILIRNVDLVAKLRSTMEAERAAAEQAQTAAAESNRLKESLESMQINLSALQGELTSTREERDEAGLALVQKDSRIDELMAEVARLVALRDTLTEEKTGLESEKQTLQENLASVQLTVEELEALRTELLANVSLLAREKSDVQRRATDLAGDRLALQQEVAELVALRQQTEASLADLRTQMEELVSRYVVLNEANEADKLEIVRISDLLTKAEESNLSLTDQLTLLRQENVLQEEDLIRNREQFESQQLAFQALEGEYVDLEEKYNKLIRPARSEVGKTVVEVRFRRTNGGYSYELREAGQSDYLVMSEDQLHERLSVLQARDPNDLYTRIVIPEDSGLSYNEAWGFTNDILSRYDYYHQ